MKTRKERHPAERKSFWETAPGMLTAIAALITALGGCAAVIVSNQRILDSLLPPSVTPSPVYVPTEIVASTFIPGTDSAPSPSSGSISSQSVQLPDGSTVTMIDQGGYKYQYTISLAQLQALPPDKYLLHLQVRMWTNYPYGTNFWSNSFRLSIGDVPLKPSNFLDELISQDETKEGNIEFEVDASIQRRHSRDYSTSGLS